MEAVRRSQPHRPITILIREFLEEQLEDLDETDLGELTNAAWRRFAEDDEFYAALLDDALPLLVSTELRMLANARRATLLTSGRVLTDAALDDRARRWMARTLETVGDGHRKALLRLNKPEGEHVLAVYDDRIAGLSRYRNMVAELVKGLPDNLQTIGERYTDLQLNTIWIKHLGGKP